MQIVEGSGNDTVVFGSGATKVSGGTGTELYTFINGQAGGTDVISNFKVGVDQVNLFGYGTAAVQQQASGGGTLLSLTDHTSILLAGVTQLSPNSIAQG